MDMFDGADAMTYPKPAQRPKPTTKQELRTWIEEYCRGEKNHGEPNTWDVTLVTDMSELFKDMPLFNAPIDQWDTSKVTTMRHVYGAIAFNQPLTFDTSQVTDMQACFWSARAFNQPLTFDTSQVTICGTCFMMPQRSISRSRSTRPGDEYEHVCYATRSINR